MPWAITSSVWRNADEDIDGKSQERQDIDARNDATMAILSTVLSSILATLSRFGELFGSQEIGSLNPRVGGLLNSFVHTLQLPLVALLSWLLYQNKFGSNFELIGVALILFGLSMIFISQWLRYRQELVDEGDNDNDDIDREETPIVNHCKRGNF